MYDSFINEDSRPKVTMTKNELTRLLGINTLKKNKFLKKNAKSPKSKDFNTMMVGMDILCDFLVITKDDTNGVGVEVQYLGLEK